MDLSAFVPIKIYVEPSIISIVEKDHTSDVKFIKPLKKMKYK